LAPGVQGKGNHTFHCITVRSGLSQKGPINKWPVKIWPTKYKFLLLFEMFAKRFMFKMNETAK